jgi:hypothetical protein
MTEPKLIETVEEALEAEKQGRLQWFNSPDEEAKVSKAAVWRVNAWVKEERLCWKPARS